MANAILEEKYFFSAHYSTLIVRNSWWLQLTSSAVVALLDVVPPRLPHQRAAPSSLGTTALDSLQAAIASQHYFTRYLLNLQSLQQKSVFALQNATMYRCGAIFSGFRGLVGFLRTQKGGGTVDGA
jgi:hypothetical protein